MREIVGREGRSPNPELVQAIRKWPAVETLKDLQSFVEPASRNIWNVSANKQLNSHVLTTLLYKAK